MLGAAPFHADLAEAPRPTACAWLESAGARLRVAVWSGGARGTVVLFNGRSEYVEKYGRVIARLLGLGFSVATLDWRGQGLSSRPEAAPMRGDVIDFDLYQRDVAALMSWGPAAALPRPQVLLGHSMGGCIGLRAMVARRVRPDAAIFSAPMWGLRMSVLGKLGARAMCRLATLLGLGFAPVPGQYGDTPYVLAADFEDNLLTSCPEHYAWFRKHLKARPELGLGAPSLRWIDAAFREMASLGAQNPPSEPTLLLLGSEERIVSPEAVELHAERTGAPLVRLNAARHEVLMEPADRAPGLHAWHEIEGFLRRAGI